MMNWIWFGLIFISVVFGALTGRMNQVSQAAITGACDAVTLFIFLLGTICLWNGIMNIADKTGVTQKLQKLLLPVTKRLFPDIKPGSKGMKAISMNMVANFLGLGNAATPLGLQAIREMSKDSPPGVASNSMVTFVVLNTASIQLIPTTIAAIRLKCGAAAPFDILPAMWLASTVTLLFGIFMSKMLARFNK